MTNNFKRQYKLTGKGTIYGAFGSKKEYTRTYWIKADSMKEALEEAERLNMKEVTEWNRKKPSWNGMLWIDLWEIK